MNRDDVTRMAREAGLHIATDVKWMPIVGLEYAEKFAALIASAEREACAKVCEQGEFMTFGCVAEAIRARGQA